MCIIECTCFSSLINLVHNELSDQGLLLALFNKLLYYSQDGPVQIITVIGSTVAEW